MNRIFSVLFSLLFSSIVVAQKDSLQLGDRYAEDQIYLSISYGQLYNQPTTVGKSRFSYALSVGFIKDFILNKQGNISFAVGFGYGYDFFNHTLILEEENNTTFFSVDNTLTTNRFKSHNLEFPLEIRWRTSTAKKYNFWRIYSGVKLLYNISNHFKYTTANNDVYNYSNISTYTKFQYGLTLSAGYDAFNINVFYGLTPLLKKATIEGEKINTKILKIGLIFYIL